MKVKENIYPVDSLIGKTVLSRATGNKLGIIHDLLIDPIKGILLGFVIQISDNEMKTLDYRAVYSFGPDAVMADGDDSIISFEANPLAGQPGIKKDIAKAKVITEGGKSLGQVANVFVHLAPPPVVIYEVRESLLDQILGRALFIPASIGRALSADTERIIVPNDTVEKTADSLETLAQNYIAPLVEEQTAIRGRDEILREPER